jgi:hypothetical protein
MPLIGSRMLCIAFSGYLGISIPPERNEALRGLEGLLIFGRSSSFLREENILYYEIN